MTMRIYKSTDASAPTLSGTAGDFVNLLDKCLVAGYGSMTAAGWTKPFTGTNRASFKQGAGCGFYIDVIDDGSLTAGAREAQFTGFETMSAVGTGTGLFPTVAQQATGLKMRKSDTADGTTRTWTVMADAKTFYVFVISGASTLYYAGMGFGDFYSLKAADAYNCMAIGRITSAAIDTLGNEVLDGLGAPAAVSTAVAGHYMARGYTQVGASIQFGLSGHMFGTVASGTLGIVDTVAFPNPVDTGFYLARCYVLDPTTAPTFNIRGYLRGFWSMQHTGTTMPGEIDYAGVGGLSGRTFRVLGLRTGGSASARYTMETSDTWD